MAAILIVAHAPLASALQTLARHTYADSPHAIEALDVVSDTPVERVESQARALMTHSAESEWIVLTDVFGATPCNAALRLAEDARVRVVSGVNVPMLWRTLCYADEALDLLVTRAVAGATQGVMQLAGVRPPIHQTRTGRLVDTDLDSDPQ